MLSLWRSGLSPPRNDESTLMPILIVADLPRPSRAGPRDINLPELVANGRRACAPPRLRLASRRRSTLECPYELRSRSTRQTPPPLASLNHDAADLKILFREPVTPRAVIKLGSAEKLQLNHNVIVRELRLVHVFDVHLLSMREVEHQVSFDV